MLGPHTNLPGQLFQVDSAAIQVLPLGDTSLGWRPVPAAAVQPVMDRVNNLFGSRVELTGASVSRAALTDFRTRLKSPRLSASE